VSGPRTNFHKTKFRGTGLKKEVVDNFSRILNFKYMKNPFKYLGLPIGGILIDRVRSKLINWKCLIKFIISIFSLYYLSFIKASKSM